MPLHSLKSDFSVPAEKRKAPHLRIVQSEPMAEQPKPDAQAVHWQNAQRMMDVKNTVAVTPSANQPLDLAAEPEQAAAQEKGVDGIFATYKNAFYFV